MSDNTTSDDDLKVAIREKMLELTVIGYPRKCIQKTLVHMAKKTGNDVWIG